MKKSLIKKYARLVIRRGVNLQKGQDVLIRANVDQGEFVTYVVEEAYKAGARKVEIDWVSPSKVLVSNVKHQSIKTLTTIDDWKVARMKHMSDILPAFIYIESDPSDALKGMDQKKAAAAQQANYKIMKEYIEKMENKYQWVIVGVPSKAWAKEVFPELSTAKAVEKLWENILFTSRVTDDPIAEWERHDKELSEHCDYLNGLGLVGLEYKNAAGTDFSVELSDEVVWRGGQDVSISGIRFDSNIPTEEVFTSPIKGKAEGKVVATKPLCYNGELIENFYFVFREGKVVEAHAEKNDALLQQMLDMDENARYLGECALVPFESPINQTGVLFYNTLYDENASCHLALGRGFTDSVKDFEKKTKEDFDRIGINDSMIHEDFMICSRDLSVIGTTRDGRKVKIFENGTWAERT